MPQVTVTSMARGADGRMWIGTQNGLARSDGQAMEVYQVNEFPALGSNWIKLIQVADNGDLWVSTLKHLVRWRDGRFDVMAQREQIGEVTALSIDSSGKLWVAADRLWYFDGVALVQYDQWQGSVRTLVAGANVWVANDNNEITKLTGSAAEFLSWPVEPLVVRQMAIIKQRLWVATSQGLYRSNGKQLERMTESPVIALTTFGDALWFVSEQGVFVWRGDHIEAQLLTEEAGNFTLISTIFVDENHAFWLGSQAHGARYFWRASYAQISTQDGLSESSWSLLPEKNGLLVGTNRGLFLGQKDEFKRVVGANQIPGGVGYALLRDSSGRLWVGTREGLAVQEKSLWRPIKELRGQQVNSLLELQSGDILIGAARGLYRWDGERVGVLAGTQALVGKSVRSLLEDNSTLWIGTENGLKEWRVGELTSATLSPLAQEFVPALLQLQDGRVLAATYQRGIFIKSLAGPWRSLELSRGLPTQGAFGLFEHDGWVWISNGDGVQRIPVDQLEAKNPMLQVVYFDEGQKLGRSRLRCCNGGGNGRAVIDDGYAWFSSLAGVVRIDTNLPEVKVPVAKVRKVLDVGKSESRLMKDLEVHYSVLDFRNAQQIAYRYRMKPYNNQWQEAGDRRIAYYTNLPPGPFVFEVQAKQAFGRWGPVASATIVVEAYYYETLWFKCLIAALVLIFLYGIFRVRTFSLRTRSVYLAQEIQARTEQLETMNSELERVNKKLHLASITDPLTGLHNRRFMTEQIGVELARMKRQRQQQQQVQSNNVLGFFLIDLDWFKHVNDRYGHGVGDMLLAETASNLKKACRESDMLLRWGGEEFLLLAPDSNPSEFSRIADRLRRAVAMAGEKMGLPQRISASIGCVPHPLSLRSDIDNWTFTLALADYCLYQAKAAGRNCSVTAVVDDELLSTYREAKITSTELSSWRDEGRLNVRVLESLDTP
ncbi:diguanylate cyclase [Simiduia litorea]